jgi:hypothetical protein
MHDGDGVGAEDPVGSSNPSPVDDLAVHLRHLRWAVTRRMPVQTHEMDDARAEPALQGSAIRARGRLHHRYRRCGCVAASAGRLMLSAGAALVLHLGTEIDLSAI